MAAKKVALLASLLVVLATAAAVAGPADAVTLCRVNENPCSEANAYRVPTEFAGALERTTNAVFSGTPSVTCEESWGSGETTVAGTPLIGESNNINFAACGGGCTTVEARHLPWKGEVGAAGGGNGTITAYGAEKQTLSVRLTNCLTGATCFYGVASATAEIEGGESAKFTIVKTLNREEGSSKLLCALTNTFSGTYRLTTPTEPVFVEALP
jgi:hypothetical protein